MRDRWYADNRDLIKWGVLLRLAGSFEPRRILQLGFYRPSEFGQLVIDGQVQGGGVALVWVNDAVVPWGAC
jgi:hypothetical protein